MIKKLLLVIFSIFIFTHAVLAQELFRVTSVNFDTSNSLIFLTSPDNTSEAIMKNVKLTKLQNPKRVFFDINSAILTAPAQNWYLNEKGIKQVKISQFSRNPNKIRVVLFLDEDFNMGKISFLKVNNNIVLKFRNDPEDMFKNQYFQTTYSDEKFSSSNFYEKLSITNEEIDKIKTVANEANTTQNDTVLNQIQQSFDSGTANTTNISTTSSTQADKITKELKLKSKYYLNLVSPKTNGLLISGFGVVGTEKPMYLTNPARVIFDIPNSIVNPNVKDKEFKIGEDTIKISQYELNKTRITITSNELEKYIPIFSADGQSVFLAKGDGIDTSTLFSKLNDAVSYEVKKLTPLTNEFLISFNAPVVHSVRRDNTKLTINFYNTLCYNEKTFKNIIENSDLSDMEMDLLPQVGLKLNLPIEKDTIIRTYMGSDGKSIKVIVKESKARKPFYSSEQNIILPKCKGKKDVVLDAGHGGADYGAIRAGINEKDINLDVVKRVQALLESKGVTVTTTRDKDETLSLADRAAISAETCPDIFVSVHVNSSSKQDISGIETHYYHPESLGLAQTVHSSMVSYIKSKDRGLFRSKFYVINHTQVPAILVEIGFISNDDERADLVSDARKQQTAKAIAEGIIKYLNKK